jgi:hypothetical protein
VLYIRTGFFIALEHDPEKHGLVLDPRVGTGFASEFAPNLSKRAFSSREPEFTSLENAQNIMLKQKDKA